MPTGIGNIFSSDFQLKEINPQDELIAKDKMLGEVLKIVNDSPHLTTAEVLEKIRKQPGLSGIFLGDKFGSFGSVLQPGIFDGSTSTTPTTPTTPAPPATSSGISQNVQLLINAIPIAHEGHVITSEYHNSLRDALRAIAGQIGLTVQPVSTARILTFAPNFMPLPPNERGNNIEWIIDLSKASVPPEISGDTLVQGGLPVQLPDDAMIQGMIVRFSRASKTAPDPKVFKITLNRLKLDSEREVNATPILVFDLKAEKEKFKQTKTIKDLESDDDTDFSTNLSKILNLSRINNETHQYFVTAEWNGVKESAKFAVNSIQIVCQA
ncbi:MAG: hypothetical protein ABI954_15125 [Pyrinomonadaceae bacterium]